MHPLVKTRFSCTELAASLNAHDTFRLYLLLDDHVFPATEILVLVFGHVCAGFTSTNVDQDMTSRIHDPSHSSFNNCLFAVRGLAASKQRPQTEKLHVFTTPK